MLKVAFNNYLVELMCAEIYFPAETGSNSCIFNHFRSRKQYLFFWLKLSDLLYEELKMAKLDPEQRQYIFIRLQEIGKLFVIEDQEVVGHRYLLIYCDGNPVCANQLDSRQQYLLRIYLKLQHDAWIVLCNLCNMAFALYQGHYCWIGNSISLLELGDALWVTGCIRPLDAEKTKEQYLRRLLALFHCPVPEHPGHRLGELPLRGHPDSFITSLHEKYSDHWRNRDV